MTWSDQIADRYRCVLSPVLADWFDGEIWKLSGVGEYREPSSATSLLQPAPEMIWPALMGFDFLPVISNTAGDWLCVRIDQNNQAHSIVQWYHGGGDWIEWGNDLAEAIVFDALHHRLPGPLRRHAIPAEDPRPLGTDPDRSLVDDPMIAWALRHLPTAIAELFRPGCKSDPVDVLLDHHIAETAVRCELVQASLDSSSGIQLSPEIVEGIDASLSDLAHWMFDTASLPHDKRAVLSSEAPSLLRDQDWDQAEIHAKRVTELSPTLAWGWDIAGYAAERRGDLESAKFFYLRGSECSVFTDQSIRLQTHWSEDRSAKFSVARLLARFPDVISESPYLRILCETDHSMRFKEIADHWVEQAENHRLSDNPSEACECFIKAGWDVGARPLEIYRSLLEQIAETAEMSGQSARAEIARTHLACFLDRYPA